MRGCPNAQLTMLAVVDLDEWVLGDYPLQRIKAVADAALTRLSSTFDRMYARVGRALDAGAAVFGSLLWGGRAMLLAVLDRLQARVALNATAARIYEQRCRAEHPAWLLVAAVVGM